MLHLGFILYELSSSHNMIHIHAYVHYRIIHRLRQMRVINNNPHWLVVKRNGNAPQIIGQTQMFYDVWAAWNFFIVVFEH